MLIMIWLAAIIPLCLVVVDVSKGLPLGAPCWAGMTPAHGRNITSLSPPFRLDVSPKADCYNPGQRFRVVLRGQKFHGFVLRARTERNGEIGAIGDFSQFNGDLPKNWRYNCYPSRSSITHNNPKAKGMIDLSWTAPVAYYGKEDGTEIQLVATVFYSYPTATNKTRGDYWHEGASYRLPPCNPRPRPTQRNRQRRLPVLKPKFSQNAVVGKVVKTTRIEQKQNGTDFRPVFTSAASGKGKEFVDENGQEFPVDWRCYTEMPKNTWCLDGKLNWEPRWYHVNGKCKPRWWDSTCPDDSGFLTQQKCRRACFAI